MLNHEFEQEYLIKVRDRNMPYLIYAANAGDSRIVVSKKGVAYTVTVDNKPELDLKRNRIYKADGWVGEGRIKGNLNLVYFTTKI